MKKFLKFRWVELQNFRAFSGRHRRELGDGLVRVAGTNFDTRGDSGSGKTSILLGITYVLNICPYSGKNLATRPSLAAPDLPMLVSVGLDSHEGPAVLRRGVEGFSFEAGGEVWKGAAAEEKLDALCGLTTKLRKALCYRQQKKPGAFLSMTNREKVRFLVDLLDLGWLEKQAQEALKRIPVLEQRKEEARVELKLRCEEADRRRAELPPPPADPDPALAAAVDGAAREVQESARVVAAAEEALRRAELRREAARERVRKEYEVRERELPPAAPVVLPPPGTAARDALVLARDCRRRADSMRAAERAREAADRSRIEAERAEGRAAADRASSVEVRCADDLRRFEVEAEKLRRALCPTCERRWDDAAANLAEMEAKIRALEIRRALSAALAAEKAREMEAAAARQAPFLLDPAVEKMEAAARELEAAAAREEEKERSSARLRAAEQASLKSASEAAASQLRAERASAYSEAEALSASARSDAEAALADSRKKLGNARLAHASAAAVHLRNLEEEQRAKRLRGASEESLRGAEERRSSAEAAAGEAERDLAAEQDYLDLARGFLARVFGEVLAEIAEETTSVLAALPNARHLSLRFAESKQTAEGSKDEIVPVVSFGGEERPLDSEASGGQFTSVEVATDLAVSRVVARRTGCDLGLLLLDEALWGLDAVTKRECLEVLRRHAEDHLVMVIEHASEFQELFDREIRVEHEGERSRFAADSL